MWIVVFILFLVIVCGAYVFTLMPNPRRPLGGLSGRHYAHRGLWDNERPENSMPAFLAAVEHGYGIELDVHLTADGQLAVFHDDDLNRMCGAEGDIQHKTMAELRELRLLRSAYTIPTLPEVLRLVNRRVPLIIELKTADKNAEALCQAVSAVLDAYRGDFCIESFDPMAVQWWGVHRPSIIRGLLAHSTKGMPREEITAKHVVMESLAHCVVARPDFIAYDFHNDSNIPMRIMRLLKPHFVAWTVRSQTEMDELASRYDLQIFEGFEPEARA